MNYEKILDNFIDEIKEEGTYATKEEIREVLKDTLTTIKKYHDDTPEEIVEKIIVDNIKELQDIKNTYPIPGFTIGVNIPNINVKMYGGDIDSLGRKMEDNTLFDIASMTKFYTQIIAYNLIKEGVFSYTDKVKDLDQRFINVEDLTVGDVLSFTTKFRTDGRLSEKKTIDEALNCLYTMSVEEKGNYNYNDMGMMLTKELMENVTGKSYKELFEEYIIDKLALTDTHLIVPENKIERLTGSANASKGKVNDPSALSVGGYSGHAGVFATSDDLIKLGKAVFNKKVLSEEGIKDAYTPGIKDNRGVMGNTYTSHPKGIAISYVDKLEPLTNFVIQGSTRVQSNIGKNSVSTILLNPASMSIERAKEEERKINEKRVIEGKTPVSLVKHFNFIHDAKEVEYDLIDARLIAPGEKTVEPITTSNAKLVLRLRLLNKVIEEYDKNYNKEVNIQKRIK